jgi:hypothetical protein
MGENKRAWTKRGEMLDADKAVIRGLADNNQVAARIFVTGEAAEGYIGEEPRRLLINVNNVLVKNKLPPLFVETRADTIRMTRFDPEAVWGCFHPDLLVTLLEAEIGRLGVEMDPWKMDYFDFYQSMIAALKRKTGDAVAVVKLGSSVDDFYNAVYLSCLLLFGKPGYMDVPVAEHFAQASAAGYLRNATAFKLNDAAQKKLTDLRQEYGGLEALTNQEMHFVLDLYQGVFQYATT